jgi:hypothetical protein
MENIAIDTDTNYQDEKERHAAANRGAMLRFQQEGRHRLRAVRNHLEHLLWFQDLKRRPDGRTNWVPCYVMELLLGLVRMFAVKNSADAPRLRSPEKFVGEWRRLSREELANLRLRFLNGVSLHQMKQFLRLMEEWKIIDRRPGFNHDNKVTTLYIRFNADRLLEIIKVELSRAKRERRRSVPIVDAAPSSGMAPAAMDAPPLAASITSISTMAPQEVESALEQPGDRLDGTATEHNQPCP